MDFDRTKAQLTSQLTLDTCTHTRYPPYEAAGLRMMSLAISKERNPSENEYSLPERVTVPEGRRKNRLLSLTDIDFIAEKDKFCADLLSGKIMRETLRSQAYIANKILQPLFKIKHKLASLVRQQADSTPLSRASFIYIKFNTVSSSQSDNRVR